MDKQTDRQTDRQTDIVVFIGKLHFNKIKKTKLEFVRFKVESRPGSVIPEADTRIRKRIMNEISEEK